jgi:hypothetical protein
MGHEIGHGKGNAGLAICSGGVTLRCAFELQDLITKPVFPERLQAAAWPWSRANVLDGYPSM